MNKWTLSKNHQYIFFNHSDSFGGCSHDIKVSTILRVLKPVLKSMAQEKASK